MENNLVSVCKLTIRDFDLQAPADLPETLEKMHAWLKNQVQNLIDHDFIKLLNTLYRIDINEQKARVAFAMDDPAGELATLIIERELLKVETRRKYKTE